MLDPTSRDRGVVMGDFATLERWVCVGANRSCAAECSALRGTPTAGATKRRRGTGRYCSCQRTLPRKRSATAASTLAAMIMVSAESSTTISTCTSG